MSGRQEPRSKHRHDPALEKHKKARQEMHPRYSQQEQGSSRGLSRATMGAAQYRDGDSSSSSNTDTKEYRVEPSTRKRKSTDRGSDGGSSDDEQEIEEEEAVPLAQFQLGQGMHYGLLETHPPSVPSYVSRVDYRGKGMTRRARDKRRIDPRGLPRVQFDH